MAEVINRYGAQYYRTPNPQREDWERDLRQMKEQGMNTVRLWAMWSWIHCPDDKFDFSHLDELMELCLEIGLDALIQVILENAPSWLVNEHMDARYVANDGQPIHPMGRPNTPGGGWPGLCLDNPPASDAAERFMTALASHFAGHPALLGYDVWNEVWFELDGYIGNQYYCYCAATIEKFKAFLKNKYTDLNGLSAAWYRRYTSWDEVQPPRYWGGYPDWLDWIEFRLANQGELLKWRVDTLRKADPGALLVSHGLPTTLGSMANHLTDDWRNAEHVDVYGLSCFPHWFNYDNIETLKVHDMIRGAANGKTFWTAETQAGPSGEGLMHSKSPSPEDIRLWNWISLAAGAKGVLYWQWRPELLGPESPGFGLTHLNGTPTSRTEAASWFARFALKRPEFVSSRPIKGQIAIAVLPESQLFCHVAEKNAGKYAQSVRGAYKAFTQAGYQVDFAKIDQIKDYPVVYLPFPLMIEENPASVLVDYVKTGGILISEACPAQFGNGGRVQLRTPGYGLDDVFGVYAESGPETLHNNAPVIEWNGGNVACVVHRQYLTLVSAEVLAEYSDGGAAVTLNDYGLGKAILIGSYPGISVEWGCHDAKLMLAEIVKKLQIVPHVFTQDSDVIARVHKDNGRTIVYLVNLAQGKRQVSTRISEQLGRFNKIIDLVSNEQSEVFNNTFSIDIDAQDGRMFRLLD